MDEIDKNILFCEVKLSSKRLNQNELILKSKKLLDKYKGYNSKYLLLSVDDIDKI
ncbi:hypothetical protein RZR97_05630 [Hydrogenimonas thermophila]|uniref:hypothetical protein n=1 Tax=Hydrogenimonas thermophila TaxID=223786 RepID=UPI0029370116|nr:hypothetical protein [Hydrogenimonas thermophila]WOE71197.1 hypothetical protein RZR91_05650 [Hydrogenimonas thermophila]WOE73717.1 hypothetical protein RZR97_05630 [Hydrogenimonas thermophila]